MGFLNDPYPEYGNLLAEVTWVEISAKKVWTERLNLASGLTRRAQLTCQNC